ncbi:unnamed protein product, partial [Mesorhabditis spiculigera]
MANTREMAPPEGASILEMNDEHTDLATDKSCPVFTEAMARKFDFPKVQLHLHLDGAVRYTTLWEMCSKKNMPVEGCTDIESFKKALISTKPGNLSQVLEAFRIILPRLAGDLESVERLAYETCEDQHNNGVIYFEARYAPHFLANTGPGIDYDKTYHKDGPVKADDVIRAVHRGFARAKADFGVEARSILCCIRAHDEWNQEILKLVDEFRDSGVVAIDIAGCADGADEKYEPSAIMVFKKAYELGIHRTVHSGEAGTDKEVIMAIEEMHAERIGHGYRIMRNPEEYKKRFVDSHEHHLEACPYSSVMTGSVPLNWPAHPIKTWIADGVNFSLSCDDPTCFDNTVCTELELVHTRIGLTKHQLWQTQLNGARAAFCNDELKQQIVDKILKAEPPKE